LRCCVGYTEPYAELVGGGVKSVMSTPRSAVKKMKSANPSFQQTVTVQIQDPFKDKLHLAFYDVDDSESPLLIGETKISLQHLKRGTEQTNWYRLVNCLSGDVQVAMTAIDFDTSSPPLSTPLQPTVSSTSTPIPLSGWPPQMQPPGVQPAAPPPSQASSGSASYNALLPMPSPSSMYPNAPSPHPYGQQPQYAAAPAPQPMQPMAPAQPQMQMQMQMQMQPPMHHMQRPVGVGAKPGTVDASDLLMTTDGSSVPTQPQSLASLDPKSIQRDFPHIAKGSFGVVFTGHVAGIPIDKVVIKDMEVHNQRNIDDWKKEIAMMARMRSPYVVKVLGYCSSGHILTIVMEFMRKGSLYDVLHQRKEPLSLLQRMRMARQCALSVAHLHAAAVIHRDIKSMNILCTEEYICKLTDFGCAKLINDRTIFNTANSGTPLWMAPEVRAGQYDYSADVYSLGLVLYELFENKLPFYDQMRQCVILPKQFQSASVVLPCVAAKPSSRPTAAQVVKVLDMMIRNVVGKVRKHLPPEEEYLLFNGPAPVGASDIDLPEDLDADLKRLYTHLLSKNPVVVDQLIARVFNQPPSVPSASPPTSLQSSSDDLLGGFRSSSGISGPSSPAVPHSNPQMMPLSPANPQPSQPATTQYFVPVAPPQVAPVQPSVVAYPGPGVPTTTPSLLAGIPPASNLSNQIPKASSAIDDLLGIDLGSSSRNAVQVQQQASSPPVLSPPIASHRSTSPSNANALYPALDGAPLSVSGAALKDWESERLVSELNKMTIYDLRNLLYNHNVDESHCFSKADLIDLAKRSSQAVQLYRSVVKGADSLGSSSSALPSLSSPSPPLSPAETSRASEMFNVYSEGASEIPRDMATFILSDLLRGRMSESEIRQKALAYPSLSSSTSLVSREAFLSVYQNMLAHCQILM
jgi:serine/threonine protein kinase